MVTHTRVRTGNGTRRAARPSPAHQFRLLLGRRGRRRRLARRRALAARRDRVLGAGLARARARLASQSGPALYCGDQGMRYLRSFGRFWWNFIVGDDWHVAAGVGVAVGVNVLAHRQGRQCVVVAPGQRRAGAHRIVATYPSARGDRSSRADSIAAVAEASTDAVRRQAFRFRRGSSSASRVGLSFGSRPWELGDAREPELRGGAEPGCRGSTSCS
jgi:hypothetical protein